MLLTCTLLYTLTYFTFNSVYPCTDGGARKGHSMDKTILWKLCFSYMPLIYYYYYLIMFLMLNAFFVTLLAADEMHNPDPWSSVSLYKRPQRGVYWRTSDAFHLRPSVLTHSCRMYLDILNFYFVYFLWCHAKVSVPDVIFIVFTF